MLQSGPNRWLEIPRYTVSYDHWILPLDHFHLVGNQVLFPSDAPIYLEGQELQPRKYSKQKQFLTQPPHRLTHIVQIMAVTVLGFMAFQAAAFYLALFVQELRSWSAIVIAVHLLPQALAGMLWNVIIGNILHRVNNTILMAAGALAYLVADLLLSLMSAESNYWAFMFPALILNVVGADFHFNVANVSTPLSFPPPPFLLPG